MATSCRRRGRMLRVRFGRTGAVHHRGGGRGRRRARQRFAKRSVGASTAGAGWCSVLTWDEGARMTMTSDPAVVRGLWRYPVKSMQGERLAAATVRPDGIDGDRRWGVRDEES